MPAHRSASSVHALVVAGSAACARRDSAEHNSSEVPLRVRERERATPSAPELEGHRKEEPPAGGFNPLPGVSFRAENPWGATRSRRSVGRGAPETVALRLDGQAGADEVALGAQVFVPSGPGIATRVEAERIFRADVVMLIFEAEHWELHAV